MSFGRAIKSLVVTAALSLLAGTALTVATASAADAATCTDPQLVSSSNSTPVVTLTPTTGARTNLAVRVIDCPGWHSNVHFMLDRVSPAPALHIEADRTAVDSNGDWLGTQVWDPYDARYNHARLAGTWTVRLKIIAISDSHGAAAYYVDAPNLTFSVLEATTMSASASATSVRKGQTATLTGQLAKANLDTHTYTAFAGRPVQLQFKPAGGSYATVKSIVSDASGLARATVKISATGTWRYSYAGDAATAAASQEVRVTATSK